MDADYSTEIDSRRGRNRARRCTPAPRTPAITVRSSQSSAPPWLEAVTVRDAEVAAVLPTFWLVVSALVPSVLV